MEDRAISLNAVLDALEMSYLKSEIDDLTYQRIKELPSVTPCLTESEKIICKMYIDDLDEQSAYRDNPCNEYKLIMKLIEDAPVTPKTQWIPVSERLPQKSEYGDVFVTYIPSAGTLWTTVMIAQYSDLMGIAKPSFHIGEVGKKSFQNITSQVTAWMPLPKPYEPQERRE